MITPKKQKYPPHTNTHTDICVCIKPKFIIKKSFTLNTTSDEKPT